MSLASGLAILAACAGTIPLGLGCGGDLSEVDSAAQIELRHCPARPSEDTSFQPRGMYRDRGERLDYDRLVPPGDNPRDGYDQNAVLAIYRSHDKLEQLYRAGQKTQSDRSHHACRMARGRAPVRPILAQMV